MKPVLPRLSSPTPGEIKLLLESHSRLYNHFVSADLTCILQSALYINVARFTYYSLLFIIIIKTDTINI